MTGTTPIRIGVLRDVYGLGNNCSMQPLIEKHVSVWRHLLPRREGPRLLLVGFCLFFVVKILSHLAASLSP